jgi:hypothetical protein
MMNAGAFRSMGPVIAKTANGQVFQLAKDRILSEQGVITLDIVLEKRD